MTFCAKVAQEKANKEMIIKDLMVFMIYCSFALTGRYYSPI